MADHQFLLMQQVRQQDTSQKTSPRFG